MLWWLKHSLLMLEAEYLAWKAAAQIVMREIWRR